MDDTIASVTTVTSQSSPKTLDGAHYNYKQLKEQCWSLNGKFTSVFITLGSHQRKANKNIG